VEVAAPRGDFVLDAGTNPVLLLSAGISVTVTTGPDVSGAVLTTPRVVRLAVAAYLARFKG
jgi:hypothetical protein